MALLLLLPLREMINTLVVVQARRFMLGHKQMVAIIQNR
jgi:hypothetical protein